MNFSNYDDRSISLVRKRTMKFKREATGFDNSTHTPNDVGQALEMKYKARLNRKATLTRDTTAMAKFKTRNQTIFSHENNARQPVTVKANA